MDALLCLASVLSVHLHCSEFVLDKSVSKSGVWSERHGAMLCLAEVLQNVRIHSYSICSVRITGRLTFGGADVSRDFRNSARVCGRNHSKRHLRREEVVVRVPELPRRELCEGRGARLRGCEGRGGAWAEAAAPTFRISSRISSSS